MDSRPNILWICTDQQRYDTIAALGNPAIHTPNIDRLCREGVALKNTYCQSPICTPSRASFLTGLYPSTIHCNMNGNRSLHLPENAKLITACLKEAGYTCGLSGKLHVTSAWEGEEQRVYDGYEHFYYSHDPLQGINDKSNQYINWLRAIGRYDEVIDDSNFDPGVNTGARYREDIPQALHQTTWCCDRALEFMSLKHDSPWLMSVNVFDPHPPYDAPKSWASRYHPESLPEPPFQDSDIETQKRLSTHVYQSQPKLPNEGNRKRMANYYGMISLVDWNVGRLLEFLEQSGQRENTIVIFTSDHGQLLGDHGLEHKGCRFYEGLVKVPLILSWPGHFQSDFQSDALVELTDIAPTLAELAGCDFNWTQGYSLVPTLQGKAETQTRRSYARCEYYDVLDPHFGKQKRPLHNPSYATMYRTEQYKLNVYHGNDYGELYDLHEDPDEHNNLWEDPACQSIKLRLLKDSFDASMIITDPGSTRIGRF